VPVIGVRPGMRVRFAIPTESPPCGDAGTTVRVVTHTDDVLAAVARLTASGDWVPAEKVAKSAGVPLSETIAILDSDESVQRTNVDWTFAEHDPQVGTVYRGYRRVP